MYMEIKKDGYLAPEAEVIEIAAAGVVLVDSLRGSADNIETTSESEEVDW